MPGTIGERSDAVLRNIPILHSEDYRRASFNECRGDLKQQGACDTPMIHIIRALFCAFLFIATVPSAFGANITSGQLCWAVGTYDNTVYFAGIEGREDRSESFASLIEISAIDTFPVQCSTLPVAAYRALRALLVEEWMEAELEVIDTTFLSDLDY